MFCFTNNMVVENVSSVNNIPVRNNFVLSAQNTNLATQSYVPSTQPVVENNMSVPQSVSAPVQVQQPKKGNKNTLWWVLGGLAVAGTAGVLIYRTMKGRGASSGAAGSQLGDFAKKFADQSILTKTLERAQADGSNIQVQANADKSVIAVCDNAKGFGAQIISKFDNNAAGKVSEFDFSTRGLSLQVTNFDSNLTHVGFIFDEMNNFIVKVDSKTGKIAQDLEGTIEGLGFLKPRTQRLVDDLDPKKLLDDDTYRKDYVSSVYKVLEETSNDYHFDRIATTTGKSIDEVKAFANGDEFRGLASSKAWFNGVDEIFNLGESPFASQVAKSMDDCDETWTLLEKMLKGEISHKVTANYTVDGLNMPKKNCFKIEFDTPDMPDEVVKLSDDGEYFSYTRGANSVRNPENYFEIELFEPKTYENGLNGYTRLTTNDASFAYKENADGIFDMQVSVDGKDVEVTDEVLESFKDKEIMEEFLKTFATKGKENIVSLFSIS